MQDDGAWTGPPHCGWQVDNVIILINLYCDLRDSFKVTCRDNGKDDPPWKEWTKDGSAVIETTFSSLFSLLLLLL